jgi:translocation and assembly module TamB
MTSTAETATKPRRGRRLWWNTAGVAVALIAAVVALVLWAGSDQFQNMVRARLAQQLQAVTGGRVEIASFHWHLLRLEAEAGGVVIHGDEQTGEAPYAQMQSMRVGLSVLGFWSPRILLRELVIVRPQFHFIFYPDGATNQPQPARQRTASRSGMTTLFDLRAGRIAVEQGDIDLDNRAAALDVQNRYQPLDFDGDDVSLVMQYVAPAAQTPERYHPEHYHIEAGIRDLNLVRGGTLRETVAPVHGLLQASLDLTRDTATLTSFRLVSVTRGGKDHTLNVAGSLTHFAHPRWQAAINGEMDLRLLDPALGYSFTPEGIAQVELASAGQDGMFRVDGAVRIAKGAYIAPGVNVRGVDLVSHVHADPNALRVTQVVAHLAQGGEMEGEVLLAHWLPQSAGPQMEAATTPPPPKGPTRKKFGLRVHPSKPEQPQPPKLPHSVLVKNPILFILVDGKVNAEFRNVALDTVLDVVGQPPFQRIGLNTQLNGPANATWSRGDVNTLMVKSTMNLSPGAQGLAGEAPATGMIDATYTQRDGALDLRALNVNLPASRVSASGRVGAYPLTSATALTVDFESRNLGEFDTILRDLGLKRDGASGTAALPVALGGEADFHGTWAGSLMSPRLAGTLKASQLSFDLPPMNPGGKPQTIHWDSVDADGSYDAEHIAIVRAQLQHGTALIAVDGTLVAAVPVPALIPGKRSPRAPSLARGDEMPAFDAGSVLHAHIRAGKIATGDLMPLAGLDLPVTGSLDAQITIDGPVRAVGGSGWAQLNDAVVYGEPVTSLRAQGSLTNQAVKVTSFDVRNKAGTVSGSGTYDLKTRQFQGEARGSGIEVVKIERLRTTGEAIAGRLDFAVSASGTRDDPNVEGHATVTGLAIEGRDIGALNLTAHTVDHALHYDATSNFESAELAVHGQTELRGDFQTQAKIDFLRFDIAALLRMAQVDAISAQSSLSGMAEIAGPLARPEDLRGDLRLPEMALVIAGVHLKSDGGVHAALDHARVTLDSVHITGDNTDLQAQGTLALKDTQRLDLSASGSVNLKLAETLDRDLTASGTSSFQVEAHGPLANPGLRGRVEFRDGSLSLEGLPNGLSQLHGTLEFNQNRLEVKSLTAMTGGGQLSLGGYLAYQHGIYADLSVTGRQIRIRYPEGVSSLADADLQLQGTQTSLLLSGKILLTRFSVSPDLDIASLAAQANAVQTVASPNAPSNHVRLDVRVQSSPQLNFQNAYAKLAGDVDLRLRGTVASPSLLGRISITEGNATIAGTRYELQRGDVTFTNPVRIQPNIDLNATARVEDYDITLGLHGTPDKMSVTYRSDPPLPEADVVALLALGRTQSEQGLYTQQQQQSVGTSPSTDVLLGGALNATVSSRVQKLFGAGSVKVDPSYLGALGNSTTRITVEEQVGKNVTLTYATNVDTSAQQLIQAEVAINRHVSLQMTRDESGVFSMVIKAIRRYR